MHSNTLLTFFLKDGLIKYFHQFRIRNLQILLNICYHFFFNLQTKKKLLWTIRNEICFTFQLLKLEEFCGQNWGNKSVKTSNKFNKSNDLLAIGIIFNWKFVKCYFNSFSFVTIYSPEAFCIVWIIIWVSWRMEWSRRST